MKNRSLEKETPTTTSSTAKQNGPLANEAIRAPRLQLITSTGENIGQVSRKEALERAQMEGLDLVMLSESGALGIPVVKIMDYGKELYLRKKKQAEAKKNQKIIQTKEIKIRPKIGDFDYDRKLKTALEFLQEGNRVKITIQFQGRELANKQERGEYLFSKVMQSFEAAGMGDRIGEEKEASAGRNWSRIYYLKKA